MLTNQKPVSLDDNGDVDYYQFTTTEPNQTVTVTMTPTTQDAYPQGTQPSGLGDCTGASTSTFDPKAQLDVTVDVLGTDGTTVIESANMNGNGGTETAMNASLPAAGMYFIRVQGTGGNQIQMYPLKAEVGTGTPTGCPDNVLISNYQTTSPQFVEVANVCPDPGLRFCSVALVRFYDRVTHP